MLKIAWASSYCHPLPEGHRFPMIKYELLPEQLLHEGTITSTNLFEPGFCDPQWITQVHTSEYWLKLQQLELSASEIRATGFPLSEALINREWQITSGTIELCSYALQYGIAFNIAGGTHHAFSNRGEGFCLLNDQVVAANWLLKQQKAKRILVVDLDVHQGNGTASMSQQMPDIFTFSMHGANNYPARKEVSSLDIGLPDGCNNSLYLTTLQENLLRILDSFQPDFIFYQAGVDILETDKLGKLSVSREGCKERDKIVLQHCFKNKIPTVVTMGGGYSEKITDIIEAHCNTFRIAQDLWF